MSAIIHLNLQCMEEFLPITLSPLNKKRWHLAFATIYSSRAFSHFNKSALSKNYVKIPSHQTLVIVPPSFPNINQSSLTQLVKDKNLQHLVNFGGVKGLASLLKTNIEHGIHADSHDISSRQEAFGTNTYRRPPTKSFFSFVWEALKDPTIIPSFFWSIFFHAETKRKSCTN